MDSQIFRAFESVRLLKFQFNFEPCLGVWSLDLQSELCVKTGSIESGLGVWSPALVKGVRPW